MEETWFCIEEDDISDHSLTDSDKIDSDTEAELYSKIHYEENISNINCHDSKSLNAQFSEEPICTTFKGNDSFYTDKRECVRIQSESIIKNSTQIQISDDIYSCLTGKRQLLDMNMDFKNLEQNSSPPKKLKSNNSCDKSPVEKLKSMQGESSSIQKSPCNSKPSKFESASESNCIIIDSSDSDNDIWAEPNSLEKSDFKINIVNDANTICLSSDSDDEMNPLSLKKRDSILKRLSMPNIKMGENMKGQWHVNNEDLYRKKKYSQRYHENIDITCSNCNRRGHIARICPSPKIIKCFICGGNHFGASCKNRICSNCYGPGHASAKCRRKANTLFCQLCNMQGHIKEYCPDLWRRYHLTTTPVKIKKGNQVRQDTYLYCWNCGRKGHFGGVCPSSFSSRRFFSTWPCVISYDNPDKLLKRRLNNRPGNLNTGVNVTKSNSEQVVKQRHGHVKPVNEINKTKKENIQEQKKLKYTSRKRMDMRFMKVQKIVKEQDFPRTPKKMISKKYIASSPQTDPQIKKTRRKQRNLNRKLKRKQKRLEEQNLQRIHKQQQIKQKSY